MPSWRRRLRVRANLLADEVQQFLVTRKSIGFEFREDKCAIHADFKSAAVGGLKRCLRKIRVIPTEQLIHRTGGLLSVASRGAIFEHQLVKHHVSFTKRVAATPTCRNAVLYHSYRFVPLPYSQRATFSTRSREWFDFVMLRTARRPCAPSSHE